MTEQRREIEQRRKIEAARKHLLKVCTQTVRQGVALQKAYDLLGEVLKDLDTTTRLEAKSDD